MDQLAHHNRITAFRHENRGASGPPLLCIHGSGGTHQIWAGQTGQLAAKYPVTALDLSGHGESDDIDTAPGESTLDAYSDDITAVAEQTDSRILVGNSLGGAIALHIAIRRDYSLDAIVLIGSGAKLRVASELLTRIETDFDAAIEYLHRENRLFHAQDMNPLSRSEAVMKNIGQLVTTRDLLTCHTFDVREHLDAVTTPVLAFTGEHDTLTPPWFHEYLATEVPHGQWLTIPDAAHLSMLEQPTEVNRAITSFLGTIPE